MYQPQMPFPKHAFRLFEVTRLVADHVFKLYLRTFLSEFLRLFRTRNIVLNRLLLSVANTFKHFAIGLGRRYRCRDRCRLAAQCDDFVCEKLRMGRLVWNFGHEEVDQLRAIWAGSLRRIREVLNHGCELARQIFVQGAIKVCLFTVMPPCCYLSKRRL